MERFENLTPEAAVDLRRELRRSRRIFGAEQMLTMQARLLVRFRHIADGTAIDTGSRAARPGRSSASPFAPLLIFYDADTRDIPASSTGGGI